MTAIEIGRRPVSAGELLLLPTLLQVALTELVSADKDEVADGDGVQLQLPEPRYRFCLVGGSGI